MEGAFSSQGIVLMAMRIFYAAYSSPNPDFPSTLWRDNLYQSLVDQGHEVVEFEYDLREVFRHLDPGNPNDAPFIAENRPRLSAELLKQVTAAHVAKPIQLFFSYFYDACVKPETIDAIEALGIPTVNWYCNASYQLHLVHEISPHYRWCLVPEKFRLKDYEALGARPVYCQEAANPRFYKPCDVPQDLDVSFIGQAYGDRPAYIRHLLRQGVDVHVWGSHWDYYIDWPSRNPFRRFARMFKKPNERAVRLPRKVVGGVLGDRELIETYSRSKINLGFSTCGETHAGGERVVQIRLRDFEVPMSGGFYLVEFMEDLQEFFEVGREIVCYRGMEDLADKVKYYLAHDSERERIRQAGFERCRRDHTWQRRFESAFREMGLAS